MKASEAAAIKEVKTFSIYKAANFNNILHMEYSKDLKGLDTNLNLFNVAANLSGCATCFYAWRFNSTKEYDEFWYNPHASNTLIFGSTMTLGESNYGTVRIRSLPRVTKFVAGEVSASFLGVPFHYKDIVTSSLTFDPSRDINKDKRTNVYNEDKGFIVFMPLDLAMASFTTTIVE